MVDPQNTKYIFRRDGVKSVLYIRNERIMFCIISSLPFGQTYKHEASKQGQTNKPATPKPISAQ